ncbi:MAG: hypothetical protein P1V81_01820 [Planctomycetota bacterium]|nr:hypothetical protein [Planctomycetota bacterium]
MNFRHLAAPTLGLSLLLGACGSETEPQPEVPAAVTEDPRLQTLLEPCSQGGYYDRDTGDPLGILLDKLQHGSTEALRRAKEELSQLGPVAVPEVARLLNRNFDGQFGGAHIQNSIEVLGRIDDPLAHDTIIKCLDHPRDIIRGAALRALATGAARPQDFERLLFHIPVEPEALRKSAATAMFLADPERARSEVLDWIEERRFEGLWPFVAARILTKDTTPIAQRCLAMYDKVDLQVGLILAAGALVLEQPGPKAFLQAHLEGPNPSARLAAVSAMVGVGRGVELADMATTDPDPTIRGALLEELAKLDPRPDWVVPKLRQALDDPVSAVRLIVFGALLEGDDPVAQDRCIEMLAEGREALQELAAILPTSVEAGDPFLERLLERAIELDRAQNHLPAEKRQALQQIMGRLRSADAAAYLRQVGLTEEESILRQRAHWWCMLQASNAGTEGRRYLIDELAEEADPARRLDLIWAVSSQRDELGRAFLMDFVQSDAVPEEVLFAADRLVRMGPTSEVAPVLKRVTLRVQQGDVRAAMQCLLWAAY